MYVEITFLEERQAYKTYALDADDRELPTELFHEKRLKNLFYELGFDYSENAYMQGGEHACSSQTNHFDFENAPLITQIITEYFKESIC